MLVFYRQEESLGVDPLTWAKILEFFSEAGWTPNIPTFRLVKERSITVAEEDAQALAQAGRVVQEEALKDPMAACSRIDFDMAAFAEIIEFASEGGFSIKQQP